MSGGKIEKEFPSQGRNRNRTTHSNTEMSNSMQGLGIVKTEQLVDEYFMEFMEIVRKGKGFKGTVNTHSRNQLVYLTPQKRLLHSNKELEHVKEDLY